MPRQPCPRCSSAVEPDEDERLACPSCGYEGEIEASHAEPGEPSGPWDFSWGFGLDEPAREQVDRARRYGTSAVALSAFAVGVGLILIGAGNGVVRLTNLATPGGPGSVFGFVFHLLAAAVVVMLGATLLPVGLEFRGTGEEASLEQPAFLFSVLWLVIGVATMFAGMPARGSVVGGGLVLTLAGIFGLVAVSSYDPRRTGSSITAGVLGLVGGGLLIGGAASVPTSLVGARTYGAELVFRYADPVHGSGVLVAVLTAAVYPFVAASRRGRAGVLLGLALGGAVWGLGELLFTVLWLAQAPWTGMATLAPGTATGYGIVIAGGLATLLGGLAALAASIAGAAYAGLPLANLLGPETKAEALDEPA